MPDRQMQGLSILKTFGHQKDVGWKSKMATQLISLILTTKSETVKEVRFWSFLISRKSKIGRNLRFSLKFFPETISLTDTYLESSWLGDSSLFD